MIFARLVVADQSLSSTSSVRPMNDNLLPGLWMLTSLYRALYQLGQQMTRFCQAGKLWAVYVESFVSISIEGMWYDNTHRCIYLAFSPLELTSENVYAMHPHQPFFTSPLSHLIVQCSIPHTVCSTNQNAKVTRSNEAQCEAHQRWVLVLRSATTGTTVLGRTLYHFVEKCGSLYTYRRVWCDYILPKA